MFLEIVENINMLTEAICIVQNLVRVCDTTFFVFFTVTFHAFYRLVLSTWNLNLLHVFSDAECLSCLSFLFVSIQVNFQIFHPYFNVKKILDCTCYL